MNVTIWNEFRHEKQNELVRSIYPDGIHSAIAQGLRDLDSGLDVRTATLDEAEHGLSEAVVESTDVLFWWGHAHHEAVSEPVVERVHNAVLAGMGLVVLHSGHFSRIFRRLMGTACSLRWREAGERERLWVVNPGHPIARGIGPFIELPNTEMYGEPFIVPTPEEEVFISWFEGGEVFRSGCCWRRGNGKVFYFRPGHETYPIYHNRQVLQVLANAAHWAAPHGERVSGIHKAQNVPAEQAREKIVRKGGSVHQPDGSLGGAMQ